MPNPSPPRSGSRRSGSGRSSSPDRWDTSRSSAASSLSSSSSGRNRLLAAARVFGSCFAPSPTRDHDFPSPTRTPTASSSTNGSSRGNQSWKSSRGMYIDSQGSAKKTEPGGMRFTIAGIHKATKNFSPAMKIGQGGFGTVFKGVLDDGTVVAVKRAKKSMYDSNLGAEFRSEVRTLAQIEHLNLVRFLGYLEHEDERVIVIEYVPNGTLREHLDGLRGNGLELAARLDVAIDVAHAITYLHMYTDHPIIHRDIKSSNILLTENFRAKVADFGFARLGATEAGVSHVSTQVKGTAGYLDPEYLKTYQLTEKSDVYSFGVLLVELISGRRPIEPKREPKERITPKWAMKKFMDGDAIQTLDPILSRTPAANLALEKILELSRQCLAPTRQGRPSMRRCAEILWNIRRDYRELLSSDPLSQSSDQIKTSVKEEGELIKNLK